MPQKTVVSIQSLACHGKCSLTEALPILSAAGLSVSVLPTTVLSTHTGGFGVPVAAELTAFFKESLEHWQANNINFDGVYCGYCANTEQLQIIADNLEKLCREGGKIIVDPVMGDNGRFFRGITEDFIANMLSLCRKADIIVPNVTEACFMTGIAYEGENLKKEKVELILSRLFKMTNSKIVLTGIDCGENIMNAVYDGKTVEYIYNEKVSENYHGTGDIFASVLTAAVLCKYDLCDSVKMAGDYICYCLKNIVKSKKEERSGIEFETGIPYLLKLFEIS